MNKIKLLLMLAVCVMLLAPPVHAAGYPTHPVKGKSQLNLLQGMKLQDGTDYISVSSTNVTTVTSADVYTEKILVAGTQVQSLFFSILTYATTDVRVNIETSHDGGETWSKGYPDEYSLIDEDELTASVVTLADKHTAMYTYNALWVRLHFVHDTADRPYTIEHLWMVKQ